MVGEHVLWGLTILALTWLVWRVSHLAGDLAQIGSRPDDGMRLLQREVQAVRHGVDRRLREQLASARDLSERLGRLQKATDGVEQLGLELAELQRVFQPSHLRGALGERLLVDLLSDTLPGDRFRVQYTYPVSGVRVDVAILIGDDRILPIDAKFPLDNFRRLLERRERADRDDVAARRALVRDMRRHVDDIADRYLSPQDGALDIAFMYIPSESVFYELLQLESHGDGTVVQYALRRGVVPVSPSTLHAYLAVVRMGLRGFNLQRSAREVLTHLVHLGADVERMRGDLGKTIRQSRHALSNLEDTDAALRRIEERLKTMTGLQLARPTRDTPETPASIQA